MLERLQKFIASQGKYSRRQAEELIAQGKVRVDGKKVTEMGIKVDPIKSVVMIGSRRVSRPVNFQYLILHKPRRCVVTRDDPEGRKTIYDYLPPKFHHLKPVGRLDFDSEGLLLLTNDGELANKMSHPRHHISKIYEFKVQPKPTERQLQRLRNGIRLEGRKTLATDVEVTDENPKTAWIKMTLREGRNRQIRRMCEEVGLAVKTLIRTKMGPFDLTGIAYGKYREIHDVKISVT